MSERRSYDAGLERLLHDLEDGNLSADGWRKLERRLSEDPAARRKYREHMAFASALHAEARAVGEIEGRTPGIAADVAPRNTFGRSLLAAAAVLAVLAAIASWIAIPKPSPARVVAGPATEWHFAAGGIGDDGRFLEGTQVRVETGTLEMVSTSGTQVTLEAPAEFLWKRPMEGELRSGQAWFTVARGDEGFTVRIGALKVVDLSTEFGLRVSPGADEVHVGVGRVWVESLFEPTHGLELHAGEAVVAGPTGRTRGIPCQPEQFIRRLPDALPMIHWSFDEGEGHRFHSEATLLPAHTVSIVDDAGETHEPAFVEGAFGSALNLGSNGLGARSDFKGFAGGVPRTVACWIKGQPMKGEILESTGRVMHPSVVFWGTENGEGGKWQVAVGADGNLLVTQWSSSWVSASINSGTILDNRWHHIASVFTGRYLTGTTPEVIHYLNGERLETTGGRFLAPVDTRTDSPKAKTLSLGLQEKVDRSRHSASKIAIDELWVIRHALNDAQIHALFKDNEWRSSDLLQTQTPN